MMPYLQIAAMYLTPGLLWALWLDFVWVNGHGFGERAPNGLHRDTFFVFNLFLWWVSFIGGLLMRGRKDG